MLHVQVDRVVSSEELMHAWSRSVFINDLKEDMFDDLLVQMAKDQLISFSEKSDPRTNGLIYSVRAAVMVKMPKV